MTLKRPIGTVLMSCCLCSLALSTVASGDWRSTNPGGGGAFNSPVVLDNGVWAVGSDLGGVYASANGTGWIAVGALRGLTETHVASLAGHPSGKLLVGADGGLFSIDPPTRTLRRTYDGGYVSAVVVSADANRAYAAIQPEYDGVEPYVVFSLDAGETWSNVGGTLPDELRVVAMRTHPVDPLRVWVVAGEGRFASGPAQAWFSADGGASWTRRDPDAGEVSDVVYAHDPTVPGRMYLTTERNGQGVFFVSTDDGANWSEIAPDVPDGEVYPTGVLLADPTAPDHVRVIDFNYRNYTRTTYFWESFDGGASWSRSENQVTGGWSGADELWGIGSSYQGLPQTIGYNPSDPETVLWVNNQFVFHSADGGASWQSAVSIEQSNGAWTSRGVDNVVPIVVATSAADHDLVYAGYMDIGLWRSDDGGGSWHDLNTTEYSENWQGVGGNTLTVVADPERPDVVWAQMAGDLEDPGQPHHLVRSFDRGETWTELTTGLPSPISRLESLALAEDSWIESRWLFVVADGDVYLSRSDGDAWETVLDCGDCIGVWYTEASGVVAVGPSGAWRSWQGGVPDTWAPLDLPADMTSGWTAGSHWLHDSWEYVGPVDLAARDNYVWLAVHGQGKGLYVSDDWGQTWQPSLEDNHGRAIAVDPSSGDLLFGSSSAMQAGSYQSDSHGVLYNRAGTDSWDPLNNGLAYPFATAITLGPAGQRWVASPGQGVLRWQP